MYKRVTGRLVRSLPEFSFPVLIRCRIGCIHGLGEHLLCKRPMSEGEGQASRFFWLIILSPCSITPLSLSHWPFVRLWCLLIKTCFMRTTGLMTV